MCVSPMAFVDSRATGVADDAFCCWDRPRCRFGSRLEACCPTFWSGTATASVPLAVTAYKARQCPRSWVVLLVSAAGDVISTVRRTFLSGSVPDNVLRAQVGVIKAMQQAARSGLVRS